MNKLADSTPRRQLDFIGNFASRPNRPKYRRQGTMHPFLDLFDDVFKLGQHSIHGWLLRLGFLSIAVGTLGQLTQFLDIYQLRDNLVGIWFALSLSGITLLTIGLLKWVSIFKPHWNWIAITFFSLSAVLGVLILLVHLEILFPLPPTLEPETVAIVPTEPEIESLPTATATAEPTDTPLSTSTPSPTLAPTQTYTPTAEPTSSPTPTDEPELTPSATLLVIVPPTMTPTPSPPAIEFLDGYIHTVQQDETLTCITENYFGTDQYVDTLCRYNQNLGRMGENCEESLAPGRRLAIPPAELVTFAFLPDVILPPHSPDACGFGDVDQ